MAVHEVKSPMTGRVVEVLVSVGDHVVEADLLVVVESMKMENEVFSEVAGTVSEVRVEEDQNVSEEEVIFVISD
ncbi:MAG: acetyl-CoA carboxylase biotin carboxyl carrier protein subunit [Chloroflexi bacterium]|nr:acetyl-CoA carboxylase biotin carboxyl carrier protein subunit [Chloroflexota bacterium]MQG01162.1 acetyl-CoA carboxylase biotin carboxyl carrier protein subunit [SAR202 cluster bacterium]HIC49089.1 acetyl-CoA carboxylase biotin carboxyl carrier protein subunit [Dehalococcoidia bacterium]|tara:strand:+ start:39 stop:260 length:222 start_codon:yes stop_codon:yes gene_type:complete